MTVYVLADIKVTDDGGYQRMQLRCTNLTNTVASICHVAGT